MLCFERLQSDFSQLIAAHRRAGGGTGRSDLGPFEDDASSVLPRRDHGSAAHPDQCTSHNATPALTRTVAKHYAADVALHRLVCSSHTGDFSWHKLRRALWPVR